ncbi:hypothetical protein HG531_013919 [Fusarium graminearum]|nr:hypothetical protein HG531_013919 [Fusarium graminearum]
MSSPSISLPSATGVPLDRPSAPSSSSPLPLSTSESSLSFVAAGEFRFEAFFTRDRFDLLGIFFLAPPVGVPRRPITVPADLTEPALGPALPALASPAPPGAPPLGVPGPSEECLAKPLDAVGKVPRAGFIRGARFVAGPADPSLCLFRVMLAAGVAGADAACCCAFLANLGSKKFLLRVWLVASVGLDPFLNLAVAILDYTHAFVILAVFVGNLVLDELNLFGEVLDSIDPIFEDYAGIEGLGLRHPLDEVDGQIVSRHDY